MDAGPPIGPDGKPVSLPPRQAPSRPRRRREGPEPAAPSALKIDARGERSPVYASDVIIKQPHEVHGFIALDREFVFLSIAESPGIVSENHLDYQAAISG